MKSLEELVNEYGKFKPYKLHAYDITRKKVIFLSIESLESLINEVISQRLGEPVAYAYVNDDGKCEEIEYIGHKDDTGVYEEFTPLHALNIES